MTAHLDKILDLLKYEKTIQDASCNFHWEAVLAYDYQFRQYIAEYPTMSWGQEHGTVSGMLQWLLSIVPQVP